MRASIAQEDEAPSGVLPLEQVIAAAEGLTPASIVLLVLPPASGRKGLASTAGKQKRLELQTTDGVVGQRVTSSPVGWPLGMGGAAARSPHRGRPSSSGRGRRTGTICQALGCFTPWGGELRRRGRAAQILCEGPRYHRQPGPKPTGPNLGLGPI